MNSKTSKHSQKGIKNAFRSYMNQNSAFFAMAAASMIGNKQSAVYLAKLVR